MPTVGVGSSRATGAEIFGGRPLLGRELLTSFISIESHPVSTVGVGFAYCLDQRSLMEFKSKLCSLHPSLQFTHEVESNMSLSFLDVLVERIVDGGFVTSVYRKPTFTGMCLQWDSYCPVKYKVGLVRCLVNRALRICSDAKLNDELEFLKGLFLNNGYPIGVVNKFVSRRAVIDVGKANTGQRVVFRLPYVGERHCDLERRVRSVVHRAFDDVNVVTVYNVRRAFMVMKDVLPTNLLSKVVHSFECRQCDSWCVGRTFQHLNARIKQHIPRHLLLSEMRSSRPRRGRPPKISAPVAREEPTPTVDTGCDSMLMNEVRSSRPRRGHPPKISAPVAREEPTLTVDTGCDSMLKNEVRRSLRLRNGKKCDGLVNGCDNTDSVTKTYQSSIAKHLSMNIECVKAYCDDCFSVLPRARSCRHLEVLESVYIHVQRPNLCVQKETVKPLLLFKSYLAPVS